MIAQRARGANTGIQEAIWSALKHRPCSRGQLMRITGATGDQTSQALNRLRGKGWRIERTRGCVYTLRDSPGAKIPRRRAEIDDDALVAMLWDGEWRSDHLALHFEVRRDAIVNAIARLIGRGYPISNVAMSQRDLAIYTLTARRRFPPGRRCVCCGAVLNTYHEGEHCYAHEPEAEEMEVAS